MEVSHTHVNTLVSCIQGGKPNARAHSLIKACFLQRGIYKWKRRSLHAEKRMSDQGDPLHARPTLASLVLKVAPCHEGRVPSTCDSCPHVIAWTLLAH